MAKSRTLFILLFFLSFLSLHAQSDETKSIMAYIQKAMNFNKVQPQEKVYLHFDNMGYFENETMWFKAYVTRTDCGKPTDLSKVLYVELLNPTGDILQTLKYPIDEQGMAHGDMKLDTIMGSGLYEVRAYTRYMTNYGTNAVFSRVLPIFKTPETEGDYSDLSIRTISYKERVSNLRDPGGSLYKKAVDAGIYDSNLEKTISVEFYPEGGDLIAGKKCRVAMLAVDDNGHPYAGDGYVTNTNGDVLANVKTDTLGRGLLELVPDTSMLTFQMKNLKNSTKGGTQFFSFPKARTEGCTLSVDAVSDEMLATLQCSDSVCGSLLGYVIMHNGNVIQCDTMQASPLIEIELDRQSLPEGVNQLTVFDHYGRILAERLFFLCPKPDLKDSIQVTAVSKRLKPCGEVELELQTRPNANLSFSAIDAKTMTNGKRGDMKTWMLLGSEVKGYIHNVDYYFELDDEAHRRASDLLMLTQGWRRYDWRLMTEKYRFRKPQPIEDQFYLSGQLKEYRKKNSVDHVYLQAILYNKDGQSLVGNTITDAEGNYAFQMPFVDGEWTMCIYTRKKGKKYAEKKTFHVGIDRQFSPNPRYLTPEECVIQHPLAANAFLKNSVQTVEEEEFVPITQKDFVLQNVTVKAKKRYFTNDDWLYKNESYGKLYASAYYDMDRETDKILDQGEWLPTIREFVNKKLKADWSDYYNDVETDNLALGKMVRYVFDNGVVDAGASPSETTIDEVKSIYIVFDGRVPSSLGMTDIEDDGQKSIVVYVYLHHVFNAESNKGLRRTYFQGFNQAETFKTEDYSVIPPMADFRRTLWWQPEVKTDSEGKAKIKFYNNSTCEEMYISVEGMDEEGRALVNQ